MAAALDQMTRQGTPLRIGQLADLLGVRTSTLRFWERAGLIRPSREQATAASPLAAASDRPFPRCPFIALSHTNQSPSPSPGRTTPHEVYDEYLNPT
jgi:hypothetical protein